MPQRALCALSVEKSLKLLFCENTGPGQCVQHQSGAILEQMIGESKKKKMTDIVDTDCH